MYTSGHPVPLEDIPQSLLGSVGPDAPDRARLMTAKAFVPMAPKDLGVALAVLRRDEDEAIAEAAALSLKELPDEVRASISGAEMPGSVLDVFAHEFHEDNETLRQLVSNRATLDETVSWMARNLRGPVLDYVSGNQVRILRSPAIVESLIANSATPTPTLAYVVETVIRSDMDTSVIHGFRTLAEAFFADLAAQKGKPPSTEIPSADELEEGELAAAVMAAPGVDDEMMSLLLDGGMPAASEDSKSNTKPLWRIIAEMSLPQKVRLAMQGNVESRRLLVRDPKKIVSMAVMRSPKLTDKEVANFAQDKAIDTEVIRMICRNREWTRNYHIVHSLVWNPKCPVTQVSTFVKVLRRKDLQQLARAKEVPTHVTRQAKQLVERRGW